MRDVDSSRIEAQAITAVAAEAPGSGSEVISSVGIRGRINAAIVDFRAAIRKISAIR